MVYDALACVFVVMSSSRDSIIYVVLCALCFSAQASRWNVDYATSVPCSEVSARRPSALRCSVFVFVVHAKGGIRHALVVLRGWEDRGLYGFGLARCCRRLGDEQDLALFAQFSPYSSVRRTLGHSGVYASRTVGVGGGAGI